MDTNKGIFTSDNVSNGVYIYTNDCKFIEPKFWGLYEQEEKAICAAIVNNGNALFVYPEDMRDEDIPLLDWGQQQTGEQIPTIEAALKDYDGEENTKALSDAGSEIAKEILILTMGERKWHIPALGELQLMHENKEMLDATLVISGNEPLLDSWYWSSTRRSYNSNFVFDWDDGCRCCSDQDDVNRVRPVSASSLSSL